MMAKRPIHLQRGRRGVTLFLTLLLLALASLFLAQQSLRAGTSRLASLAEGFNLQARWLAEGAARQWLGRSQDPAVSWDQLLGACHWQLANMEIQIQPSAAETKLLVQNVKPDRWVSLWGQQNSEVALVERPQEALVQSGYTALECLIDTKQLGNRAVYVAQPDKVAPADLLTVWGDGKVDLNRASRQVLAAVLEDFTDAQVDGILRLRRQAPLASPEPLIKELSLSAQQQETLLQKGTFSPRYIQLLVQVHRGRLQALYHVVLDTQRPARVLELRALQ